VSIDVRVVGSSTLELEKTIQAWGLRVSRAPSVESLISVEPGQRPPDVVVLDLRQEMTVPATVTLLKTQHPAIGIVIVAAAVETALMVKALRAGVSEYVTEPITRADLASAIARVAAERRKRAPSDVLAVIGAKGGVGATTIAVNVATWLTDSAPGSVVLIDLNPALGDAAVFLGVEPRFSMQDAVQNTARLDESYLKGLVENTTAGPDLLASPDRALAAEADPRRVRAVVEAASRCYRYVVLDVPRWEPSVAGALELASSITVVTTQDAASLKNGHRLTSHLGQRYGANRVRVVVNRFDRAADVNDGDIHCAMGEPPAATFSTADRFAVNALNKGQPIVLDSQSRLGGEFRRYTRTLVEGSEQKAEAENPSRRLFGIRGGRRQHPPGR
jgi:pilus assembly protein CpaE